MTDYQSITDELVEFFDAKNKEPLDGYEVDAICERLKAEMNLHQGNITPDEYNEIIKNISLPCLPRVT